MNNSKKLLNIQFFAGPGVGKSTLSSGLFFNMKMRGYKVEFISEYAKGLTYSQDYTKLKDQLMVLANQYHKFYRTKNSEIDYLVHESPFLLGLVYFKEDEIIKENVFSSLVINMYKNMNNINIFIERNPDLEYQTFGRNQTLQEAIELDKKILKLLDDNNIHYYKIKADKNNISEILNIIQNHNSIGTDNSYVGNIGKLLETPTFVEYCKYLVSHYNLGTRTYEEALEHTLCGEAVETLVCEKLNLTKTDFNVITHDAEKDGKKYEIKHTISDSEWWVFDYKNYEYFLSQADNIDYIILAHLDKKTNNVRLKYIANARTFKNYIRKSYYNSKYIYNTNAAGDNVKVF